jgi:hypothetical protein
VAEEVRIRLHVHDLPIPSDSDGSGAVVPAVVVPARSILVRHEAHTRGVDTLSLSGGGTHGMCWDLGHLTQRKFIYNKNNIKLSNFIGPF